MNPRLKILVDWAKGNPVVAGLYGAIALFVVVFLIVIIALVSKPSGPTPKDLSALEQEANMAKRVRKLSEIEGANGGAPSKRYVEAMSVLYEAITHNEALPEDVVVLARVASEAGEIQNPDFAWWVQIETRLRRGVWPRYPELPPTDPRVITMLKETLQRNPRIEVSIPKDLGLRQQWLRFAVEGHELEKNPKAAPGPLLGELYKEKDSQENHLMLYQQLAAIGPPTQWMTQRLYNQLGLLPEPLYVLDHEPVANAPTIAHGPENTLLFLGVLEGERCAIAMEQKLLPQIWVRACKGLEPRRLARGELFLLGVDTKFDSGAPMHWLPLLFDDAGQIAIGTALRGKVDDRVLASFIVAAPRFVYDGKAFKTFAPALELTTAFTGQDKVPSFKTSPSGKAQATLLAFASSAKVKLAKACPKLDKDRCDALTAANEDDKCDVGAPMCMELPNGTTVRWARVTVIHPEPCMKEYGRKSACKFGASTGVFVDLKSGGDFTQALFANLHEKQADSDD